MPQSAEDDTRPAPKWVRLAIILVIALAGGWMILNLYTSDTARGCRRLYHAAHNALDSARVDATVPAARSGTGIQTRSCGYLRTNARWQ